VFGFRLANDCRGVQMSTESLTEPMEKTKEPPPKVKARSQGEAPASSSWGARLADVCLIFLFLVLACLLGSFPLKDADIYWHLRTGDLIRQSGQIPRTDIFTFSREGVPWIDLHWLFQIAISWVHQHGGVIGLNVAKCAVTCVAVLLLVSARRREWPVWVMVLAWLPALFVLGGRMYVRPETLTLLYLSIFLAILSRWDRFPRLCWLLPFVQIAWVNSHGLFVLGPIILTFGLFDAALRFGLFAAERRKWWRTVLGASLATGAACLVNPYFIAGALYPIELAGTMRNPIFSKNIAELQTIPAFLRSAGINNLPMQLHLLAMLLGAFSFALPLVWLLRGRISSNAANSPGGTDTTDDVRQFESAGKKRRSKPALSRTRNTRQRTATDTVWASGWRFSPFRFLLYVAFCILSLQATRNSHQFAAVVGAITAWNFGEWAAAIRRRRMASAGVRSTSWGAMPRLVAFGTVGLLILWVGSGLFFRMTGEGRVISLGEEPLFFPHEAARFAGERGMPSRFLSFHNGHASLFEYYHGPERKVYTDPRLEVAGPALFTRYTELERRLQKDEPGWEVELGEMGRPVILTDHEYNASIGATLLQSDHWRCVWFDAIAAVFVHDSFAAVVQAHAVDFAARHFRPDSDPNVAPKLAELVASANAYRKYLLTLSRVAPTRARPLVWLGLDDARSILRQEPGSFEGWKNLGQIELNRDATVVPSPRLRTPFDPVSDLSLFRATYALRRALEVVPTDFMTLVQLKAAFDARMMNEAALPVVDEISRLRTKNLYQAELQALAGPARAELLRKMGPAPATSWANLSALDQIVTAQLASGRAESAAALLEQAYRSQQAPWEIVEKIATLRLHLGEPSRARDWLQQATSIPRPGLRDARIATTYLVEGDFVAARRYYHQALEIEPDLLEARYCLAVLEQDAGLASAAHAEALRVVEAARNDALRSAARAITTATARFAR
jgi:tetratricopeptide (TPR) repeat protein